MKRKEWIILLLSVALSLALLPVGASADGEGGEPAAEPVQETQPVPEITPEPAPVITPEPTPEPTPEAAPEPTAEPASDTAPEPTAEPVSDTAPESTAESVPDQPSETEPADAPTLDPDTAAPAEETAAPSSSPAGDTEADEAEEEDDEFIGMPFSDYIVDSNYNRSTNEAIVSRFLREELGLNAAAVSGVLANIEVESNFNPHSLGDHGTSYGICQWHLDRFSALRSWCYGNGLDYRTLDGQLQYMKHELSAGFSQILSYLRSVSNSSDGAYNAAAYWCGWYEAPDNLAYNICLRGNLARSSYWPWYRQTVITFDANGGTITAGETSIRRDPGELFGDLPTAERRGFSFMGWYTEPVGGTRITSESEVYMEDEAELYAHWQWTDPADAYLMFTGDPRAWQAENFSDRMTDVLESMGFGDVTEPEDIVPKAAFLTQDNMQELQ